MNLFSFTKMHGLGNDYIHVDLFQESVNITNCLAQKMSNRNFGIGADGVILMSPGKQADIRMQIYNADGGQAEMCGNGARLVAKYVRDHGYVVSDSFSLEVVKEDKMQILDVKILSGTTQQEGMVRIVFGKPKLDLNHSFSKDMLNGVLSDVFGEIRFSSFFVSMGNPHCVVFLHDIQDQEEFLSFPVHKHGMEIQNLSCFKHGVNVEFVWIQSSNLFWQRTWERGSGETLACGSGVCATVYAGILMGRFQSDSYVMANLKGGMLRTKYCSSSGLIQEGVATYVFSGQCSWEDAENMNRHDNCERELIRHHKQYLFFPMKSILDDVYKKH